MIKAAALVVLTAGLVSVGAVTSSTPAMAASPDTGRLTVVHGLRGLVADVSVDGKSVLQDFTDARVTDPLTLAAGRHTVAATNANSNPSAVILSTQIQVQAGSVQTAVLGLTADGLKKAFVFPEPAMNLGDAQAGLMVRHAAAVAGVRIFVDGKQLSAQPLTDGGSTDETIAAGTHQILVRSTNGGIVLAQQALTLPVGQITTLYLTGNQRLGTVSWVATVRSPQIEAALRSVPTGDGSTVARAANNTLVALWSGLAVALLAGGSVAGFRRRRTPRATV